MKFRFLYRGFRASYRDQRAEINALVTSLKKDDVAIDVGANKGAYIPALCRAVPRGTVFAFEPQPSLASYLKEVTHLAGFRNVTVECAAISSEPGNMTLYIPGGGDVSPGATLESFIETHTPCKHISVPVITLDSYFAGEKRRIGALKVDVEGHELAVFQGASELLRAHSPTIVFECENRHMSQFTVDDVIGYLREAGYDGYFVERHKLRPIHEFVASIHQPTLGDRFWDAPGYCNNFVMFPRQEKLDR